MRFKPIFLEDVLTVSKERLENFRHQKKSYKVASKRKKLVLNKYDNITSFIQLDYGKSKDNLIIRFKLNSDNSGCDFDTNVMFYVQSANHTVKNQKFKDDCILQTWSSRLCTLSEALNPAKNFLVDGNLTIHMKAIIFAKPLKVQKKECSNMAKLLWDRDDKDFVIAVGKKDGPKVEFKIHKFLLGLRSPVFDRMLETEMKEKAQNRLEIIDFNVEVVQAAVEYFYDLDTFKSLNVENLVGLLLFADKYDINDLKAELEHFFLCKIYPDTIVKIGNASIMSNSAELKQNCIKTLNLYIKNNVQFDDAEALDKEIEKELGKEDVEISDVGYYFDNPDYEDSVSSDDDL